MVLGGVELGGTKVRCAIGTGPGALDADIRIPTSDPDTTLAAVQGFFRLHAVRPAAIGVGCFGPLDLVQGRILETPKPGWSSVDVRGALSTLGVPVVVDTDVGAALAGEYRWGAAQGLDNAVYLTIGTGIGGAFTLGAGRHPEMGHVPIPRVADDPLERGVCPFHPDCWEGWASGPAIARRWGDPTRLDADHPAWELEAKYLAQGLRAVALSFAPERILIGGGVGLRPGLLERACVHLDDCLGGYGGHGPSANWVVRAGLGEDAGLLGALALVG
jgi:fructokinase